MWIFDLFLYSLNSQGLPQERKAAKHIKKKGDSFILVDCLLYAGFANISNVKYLVTIKWHFFLFKDKYSFCLYSLFAG